jgi:hypothetical protein
VRAELPQGWGHSGQDEAFDPKSRSCRAFARGSTPNCRFEVARHGQSADPLAGVGSGADSEPAPLGCTKRRRDAEPVINHTRSNLDKGYSKSTPVQWRTGRAITWKNDVPEILRAHWTARLAKIVSPHGPRARAGGSRLPAIVPYSATASQSPIRRATTLSIGW